MAGRSAIDHLSPGDDVDRVLRCRSSRCFRSSWSSLWLLAHKYLISAVFTIVFAKVLGVGVIAFVFDVTRAQAA